jgi:hypothetical protein
MDENLNVKRLEREKHGIFLRSMAAFQPVIGIPDHHFLSPLPTFDYFIPLPNQKQMSEHVIFLI